jgi:hypothetical protein
MFADALHMINVDIKENINVFVSNLPIVKNNVRQITMYVCVSLIKHIYAKV